MINVYEFLRYQPQIYKQFTCKDLLFVYYYCPQVVRKVDVFTHYNILSFVIEGRKLMHRPDETLLLEEGHCYFLKTGAFNQELYLDEGWCSMNLYIPDSYLQQLSSHYQPGSDQKGLPELAFRQLNELEFNPLTRELSEQLLASFAEEPAPAEAVLEQRFLNLFLSILAEPRNQALVAYLSKLTKNTRSDLYTVMETNYMYNLSLTEFAQLAHQSLPTFKREFKRIFHTTPAQWLMQKRLSHTEVLLKTTEKSISDIARESGFESNSHFSRVFKSQFGESPLQYRKQLLAE
ncbi:AraC family transcriptional regulator [Spirosoma validum]|uniref:Helix-turn-helix transcriptional regulator n=1 Tax=Spirosoma validum TaxID=2771355 RepID=A0A927B6D6_9BACT|nr:AraC family transcriptional regulator [Spirosoma validum]MBD2756544.1 helix-turn-helix transcriptional regulator [Spirosoma validum]